MKNWTKKLIYALVLPLLFAGSAFSQCTPTSTTNTPGIYPDPMPTGTVGQAYSEVAQMVFLMDTTVAIPIPPFNITVPVDSVQVTSVLNLPAGLTSTCNPSSCKYIPQPADNPRGCADITGVPTTATGGPVTVAVIYDVWMTVPIIGVQMATDTMYYDIEIQAPPATCNAFMQYTLGQCPDVYFFDGSTSSGNIVQWDWDFGDGNISSLQNPQNTYTTNGNYLVCLTITTDDACTDTYCDTIPINCIVVPTCQAGFQSVVSCPSAIFTDLSTSTPGNIVQWDWDFGDGNTSTQQNPTHSYAADGAYIACLTITTSDACVSTYCDTIIVNCAATCQAAFQYTLGQCPDIYFFDGSTSSPGNIVQWDWDFGDGNTSTLQNPNHVYASNGSYITCLTITTGDSCVSTFCDTVVISCIVPPACQAGFIFNQCPDVYFFDNSTSSPGSIVQWDWDFGDGNTSTLQNPQHTYGANGNYIACLTIITTDSCISTYCDTVIVNCISQSTCQAGFIFNQCPDVYFFDNSTSSPGSIVQWDWDFGDGNTSTLQNPQHTYGANGNYLACLTITTTDSCVSTYCDTVIVNCISQSTCQALFQYTLGGCPSISFFDGSSASASTVSEWDWDFGDGNTSTLQNPTHTYGANGNYLVCLTITTTDSCVSTYCDTIPVNCIGQSTCQADFVYNDGQCPMIAFADQSTASSSTVTEWDWDFGDGNTSTLQNPQNTYVSDGTYIVCLSITTTDSCVSTFCDTIVVNCINGIEDKYNNVAVNVYPNPATDVLNVEVAGIDEAVQVQLMDVTGKVIISEQWLSTGATQQLAVETVADGVYIIRLSNANYSVNKKLIIKR
jgi:PKD repeat protein